MNRGIVRITPELLVQLLEALSDGRAPRAFTVVKNGLPAGTRYVRSFYSEYRDEIEILVESPDVLPVNTKHPGDHPSGYPELLATEMTVVQGRADLQNV